MPPLARVDGRSGLARRHGVAVKEITATLHPRLRLTRAENQHISRVAWLVVLSEQTAKRAALGEIDTLVAIRASSCADRALRTLRNAIVLQGDDV